MRGVLTGVLKLVAKCCKTLEDGEIKAHSLVLSIFLVRKDPWFWETPYKKASMASGLLESKFILTLVPAKCCVIVHVNMPPQTSNHSKCWIMTFPWSFHKAPRISHWRASYPLVIAFLMLCVFISSGVVRPPSRTWPQHKCGLWSREPWPSPTFQSYGWWRLRISSEERTTQVDQYDRLTENRTNHPQLLSKQ